MSPLSIGETMSDYVDSFSVLPPLPISCASAKAAENTGVICKMTEEVLAWGCTLKCPSDMCVMPHYSRTNMSQN